MHNTRTRGQRSPTLSGALPNTLIPSRVCQAFRLRASDIWDGVMVVGGESCDGALVLCCGCFHAQGTLKVRCEIRPILRQSYAALDTVILRGPSIIVA
ncbi:hypothetical protein E2C01_094328 [Portunus trituberculatus]|uniref:Uncharacterized protein n=1 Tax=Portunus trituberculatus TaxID=210409 RepID=A0A5B7JQ51_PORTR|nr:hypothetical protein [Portunus trituberculatus]